MVLQRVVSGNFCSDWSLSSSISGRTFPVRVRSKGLLKSTTMAGRRAALKAIDWVAFAERVPPNQKTMFNALKTRSDALSAKLASLPESPPDIDWAFYKRVVAKPGMVDEFEKKYKAFKVPEPVDNETVKIETQEQEANKSAASYIQASKARVDQFEKELQKLKSMIPFEEMTYDDYYEAFPETKPDKEKYPYWPYRPIAEW
ncbi:ATP synthase subunit d, mitochondrial [Heteronotia binoei]|uniref:ATP synthase subunit d, mitochondrial n=1 Tax=Heteronotia binoei TaxID=13085 RepID=UPI002930897A|nr:ATP synthase subunit d, mitochondrial [Heteronotia binoei]